MSEHSAPGEHGEITDAWPRHDLELGGGFWLAWTSFHGEERIGALIGNPDGTIGSVMFDLPTTREHFPEKPRWTVEGERDEHLTLSPSIQGGGYHGFIRDGKWVAA